MILNKNLLYLLMFIYLQPAWAEQAEPRWYKVEVVAFSYLSKVGLAQERWPAQPEPLDLTEAVELAGSRKMPSDASGTGPVAFQRIPDSELELKADANAISRSRGRHLLLHTAWLQPTFARQQAKAIHLRGNERFTPLPVPGAEITQVDFQRGDFVSDQQFSVESNHDEITPVALIPEPDAAESPQIYLRASADSGKVAMRGSPSSQLSEPVQANILDVSFTVSIGRYLHVWLDMIYREPIAISPEIDQEYQEFILPAYGINMHRRMRSNELHYIDHPKVGMLVKITRHELPQSDSQSELQDTDLPIATDVIPAQ